MAEDNGITDSTPRKRSNTSARKSTTRSTTSAGGGRKQSARGAKRSAEREARVTQQSERRERARTMAAQRAERADDDAPAEHGPESDKTQPLGKYQNAFGEWINANGVPIDEESGEALTGDELLDHQEQRKAELDALADQDG